MTPSLDRIVETLKGMTSGETRLVETGHGYARAVYAFGSRDESGRFDARRLVWWVERAGEEPHVRWENLDETLAELTRYASEDAFWESLLDDLRFAP